MPMGKNKLNKGAARLRKIYPARGGVKAVGILCGVDHSVASRWLSGQRLPETRYRVALNKAHGIGLLDWDAP